MNSRIGQFSISREFVEHHPEIALEVMGKVIVVRCELLYQRDAFQYVALSTNFDEIEDGMLLPEYNVVISEGGKCIEFKRVDWYDSAHISAEL